MSSGIRRILFVISCAGVSLSAAVAAHAPQQVVDPDYKAVVEKPAYRGAGPTVAIDEAHDNFHTATGQYRPFAELLRADGYKVVASARKFDAGVFAGVDVLVIANARNLAGLAAGDLSRPAFTEAECDVVRDWVRAGGSLLLIADHAPFGHAAANLSGRFGVSMGKGWAFDTGAPPDTITTQLEFSRANGLLGSHPLLSGRDPSEEVKTIRSFTGQSLGIPPGAAALMKLSATAREAATPDDLDAEAEARRGALPAGTAGTRSVSVAGRAQGLVMRFGAGRVIVLGEGGLLSAQVVTVPEGTATRTFKMGMNVPGTDDRQFALNMLHWLSGLLK
jgi:hypothetical protein